MILSESNPLELIAKVNAPYHDDDHLHGTFNFGEANISIYFDVSEDEDLYYYFVDKEDYDLWRNF